MARLLDNETVHAEWVKQGGHMERTSERLGISINTIRRHLADMGIQRPIGRPPGGVPLTDADLLALYRSLQSIMEIHQRTGYSEGHLRRRLRKLGIPPGRPGPNSTEVSQRRPDRCISRSGPSSGRQR